MEEWGTIIATITTITKGREVEGCGNFGLSKMNTRKGGYARLLRKQEVRVEDLRL